MQCNNHVNFEVKKTKKNDKLVLQTKIVIKPSLGFT